MNDKTKDKRERLLEAALKLFTERGFYDTPTSLIAKTAGVATGTLFHYFKNKEDLINGLYLEIKKGLSEEIGEGLRQESSIQEKLKLFWMNGVKWFLQHPHQFKFFQQFSSSPFITKLTRDQASNQYGFVSQVYDEAIKKGLFRKIHREFVMDYFTGHYITTTKHFLNHPEKATQKNLDAVFQILWDGIKKE